MRKVPTLFVRNPDDRRYVTEEVTPGCEWVLAGEGVATRKYDGTCIRVINNSVELSVWARREVKHGKSAPEGFLPVEHDETTGKTVGWEPWSNSSFAAFITEALKVWAEEHPLPDAWHGDPPSGTYELIGPKINGNPEKAERHRLVRHADAERIVLFGLDFTELRAAVLAMADDGYEGIVWHHPDGRMAKLKARDFPSDDGGVR